MLLPSNLKTVLSVITALLVLFFNTINPDTGTPEGAELVETQTFTLVDALTRAQGITTDGEVYYFSSNFFLLKTTFDGEVIASNMMAIPNELLLKGSNHIGGISYYNGLIYAPIEDGDGYQHPYIVLYDAETLTSTGEIHELPQALHTEGVPWVAVDAERGCFYTAEWNHAKVLNVFDLTTFELIKTVPLIDGEGNPAELHRIQDAEMHDGLLYCSGDIDEAKPIFTADPETGVVKKLFDRNLGDAEAEGLTILDDGTGGFYIITTDAGRIDGTAVDVHVRKYKIVNS